MRSSDEKQTSDEEHDCQHISAGNRVSVRYSSSAFFLEAYGSSINGMVTSVNQFLIYLGLAEAGVGTASVVALYGPLAEENQNEINGILSATRRFYNRSGYLFGALVAGFVFIYPYLITQQLSASLVRTMILILASSTLVDYFCLGKYKVLLTANQKDM